MDVLGERKSGMSNYKKIFCMSVYKIITIITFCVLLMIGSGTIFHAHNSVFMSVLQPAVRIAFLIILILTVIGSYVLLFRFFQNASKKSIIIATLIIVFMMLLVYGIILYNIQPFASSDAYNVQDLALYLAKTGKHRVSADAPHAMEYFGYYANNYFLTILLAKYFRILLWLGIQDIYIPLYILTIGGMLVGTMFLYLTGVYVKGIRGGAEILALCAGNPLYYILPLWAYTNALSVPFTAATVYFAIRLLHEKGRKGRGISAALFAGSLAVGYYIRPTVVIPAIAFLICLIVELIAGKRQWKEVGECVGIVIVVLAITIGGISKINHRYFSEVSDQNIPITHWMMMASHGTGELDIADYKYTIQFPSKEEKQKADLKRLKENYEAYSLSELFDFINKKLDISWCYADGNDLLEKVSQNRKNTVIYNWILGSKSDLFRTYCYAFRIANIGMVLLVLWKMLKKRNQDVNQVFYTLSFLGGVCFYSIWEIKASYGMPFLMFLLLLGSYGMEYLAEQMKEKCICINEGGKNFWQKTTIIIFIVSVSVMMYAEISQSVTVHKEWEVHCADIGSVRKIKGYQKRFRLEQIFYADRPYNRIVLMAGAKGKAKENNASIYVKLTDTSGKLLYRGEIAAKNLSRQQEVVLKIPKVSPEGKRKYKLTIWKKNEYAGNLNIWKRKEGVLHSYKGVMKISGDKMKSKLYLGVYLEKQEAWCSGRTAFVICLCFCVLASMVFLCCPETCLNKVKENG